LSARRNFENCSSAPVWGRQKSEEREPKQNRDGDRERWEGMRLGKPAGPHTSVTQGASGKGNPSGCVFALLCEAQTRRVPGMMQPDAAAPEDSPDGLGEVVAVTREVFDWDPPRVRNRSR